MNRRKFIILTGVGATSAGVLSACGHPEEKLIPALIPDDEYVPGIDYWKASACAMCDAGCGIIVRTREHRANKIEGNPAHPVNRGALCARGQAGLQLLYHPDRIRGPMKRAGERGAGRFEEITWDEAIKTLADKLREIKAQGRIENIVFMTADPRGVTGFAAEHLMSALGATKMLPVGSRSLVRTGQSEERAYEYYGYGRNVIPIFDIANATYLISFGARFLETWLSPVRYSLAYGEFRNSKGKARGRFVQIEPRMSLTGANADEWLPASRGSEGFLAAGIAQVILREGLVKNAPRPDFLKGSIDDYAPEKTGDQTGIPAEKIIRIAREFASTQRALAIADTSSLSLDTGWNSLSAINYLNALVDNLNKPGGVLLPESDYFDPLEKWRSGSFAWQLPFESTIVDSEVSAWLIHDANPAYIDPSLAERIKAIPFIASFSSFFDETASMADLVLPDHAYLERWDIKTSLLRGKEATVTLTRPVVKPEFNTRHAADVLMTLAKEFGASKLPFASAEELVKQAAAELQKNNGSISAESTEDFREKFIEQGVWTGEVEKKIIEGTMSRFTTSPAAEPVSERHYAEASHNAEKYSLKLVAYEHPTLGFGAHSNLPLLQELPDPMTSVMWGSWIEINPKTATTLGIGDADLVEITSPHGSVRAPAVLYPAIRPDTVALAYGQGHTAVGRYAKDRGANAALINPFVINPGTTNEIVRVNIAKVAGNARLIRFGTMLPEHPEVKR